MLKMHIQKRRLPETACWFKEQKAFPGKLPARPPQHPCFHTPSSSGLYCCLGKSVPFCPEHCPEHPLPTRPASQELGTSPKGALPYWDKEEAPSQVLHLFLCWADLSVFCAGGSNLCPRVPSPVRSVKPASLFLG